MNSPKKRNPPWEREELVLALELYLSKGLLDDESPEVIELSRSLNALATSEFKRDPEKFRNPNGVAMKLANIASVDPNHRGKGLSAGSKRDLAVWNEFNGNLEMVALAAQSVREKIVSSKSKSKDLYLNIDVAEDTMAVFEPSNILDARQRILRAIAVRRGQTLFRKKLLEAYDSRCALTSTDAPDALEAAHIIPYKNENLNHPANGLLLRADLHVLFDLGLVSIEPDSYKVAIANKLSKTAYSEMNGKLINMPRNEALHPSRVALAQHFYTVFNNS